jgi:excinuclease ABC subunit A
VREEDRGRLADSVETALRTADGVVEVVVYPESGEAPESHLFSEHYACAACGVSIPELEPRQFSFNSPFGACPECHGVGTTREVNADLVLGDGQISILEGVVLPWGEPSGDLRKVVLPTLAKAFKFDLAAPWSAHSETARHALIHGMPGKVLKYVAEGGKKTEYESEWEGVLKNVERRYKETSSDSIRGELEAFMVETACPVCKGRRLKAESLAVTVGGKSIGEIVELPVQMPDRIASIHADARGELYLTSTDGDIYELAAGP